MIRHTFWETGWEVNVITQRRMMVTSGETGRGVRKAQGTIVQHGA